MYDDLKTSNHELCICNWNVQHISTRMHYLFCRRTNKTHVGSKNQYIFEERATVAAHGRRWPLKLFINSIMT